MTPEGWLFFILGLGVLVSLAAIVIVVVYGAAAIRLLREDQQAIWKRLGDLGDRL